MAERNVNPVVKQVLELGPTVIFFLLYMRIKDEIYTFAGTEYSGFIVATVAFVPVLLIAMGILWALTGKLSRIQMFTAFMVIVFGGLTAYFNNSTFFKMKTTIVYGLFAALLGIGLWRGQSWLELFMGEMVPMEQEGWMILTKRLAMMFAVLAVANELVWRNMSEEAWVKIETFGFPAFLFVFLMLQSGLFQAYALEEDES